MQIPKAAVISAAGVGSRLGLSTPKCLLRVNGKSLIAHQLEALNMVEDVRVVVGFKEEEVIKEVLKIRDDVLFIRNSQYMKTSNSFSLRLATKGLREMFLMVDGDLYFQQASLIKFLQNIQNEAPLVAVTSVKSEVPIFVEFDETNSKVISFSGVEKSRYEWTGLAFLPYDCIVSESSFIYEQISPLLPLNGVEVEIFEIDTPQDLFRVQERYGK